MTENNTEYFVIHKSIKDRKISQNIILSKVSQAQKTNNHVFPHMWTLDQGQIQQGDWTLVT
jgi:hypothetical protein